MVNFEIEKSYIGPVIGLDEVGRGPLAGPVISCGCIFTDYDYLQDKLKFIDDSKKITQKKRKLAFNNLLNLIKKNLLIYKLGMATVKEIDEMNILEATKLSMRRAIDKFNLSKANLIIDGNFKIKAFESFVNVIYRFSISNYFERELLCLQPFDCGPLSFAFWWCGAPEINPGKMEDLI